jgi:hypothetical protein
MLFFFKKKKKRRGKIVTRVLQHHHFFLSLLSRSFAFFGFYANETSFINLTSNRYGQTDVGRSVMAQRTGAGAGATASHNPFAKTQPQSDDKPFFDI